MNVSRLVVIIPTLDDFFYALSCVLLEKSIEISKVSKRYDFKIRGYRIVLGKT